MKLSGQLMPDDQKGARMNTGKAYSIALAVIAVLFSLRVIGQALVFFFHVDFLPTMAEWYSGLIPYPQLLASQLLILGIQMKISQDLWRGSGFFAICRLRTGVAIRRFSYIYFVVMVLRYILTMMFYPERRWFGGTIPIFFHGVLAAYLFVLSQYHVSKGADHADSPRIS